MVKICEIYENFMFYQAIRVISRLAIDKEQIDKEAHNPTTTTTTTRWTDGSSLASFSIAGLKKQFIYIRYFVVFTIIFVSAEIFRHRVHYIIGLSLT